MNPTETPPSIIYVANTSWYLYNFRLPLMRAMRARGWRVIAVAPHDTYSERIEREGFQLHLIRLGRGTRSPIADLKALIRLQAIYRAEKPEVVHHFTIKPVVFGTVAARLAGISSVVNAIAGRGYVFSSSEPQARRLRPLVKLLYRVVLRRWSAAVIVQNADDFEWLVREELSSASAVTLIRGSGVDIERFTPRSTDNAVPIVLLCARMLRDKGIATLVDATAKLRRQGVSFRTVLAGGLDPDSPLAIPAADLREWTGSGLIEWMGHVDPIDPLLGAADVVVLPTVYGEGVPRSLVEGAAAGKPLVATDVPGCREIVRSGENGFLIPPGDSTALASALRRLIEDKALRLQMGASGRALAEAEFSEGRVFRETMAIYDRLR